MSYRSFRDAEGREWEVWAVIPGTFDRRTHDRRGEGDDSMVVERRTRGERRVQRDRAAALGGGGGGGARGWLCFERTGERRRLAPIPADWTRCDDGRLERYCREATVARRRREGRNALGSQA